MELYGFANAIDQHFVSYGCACMVHNHVMCLYGAQPRNGFCNNYVTEAITWLLKQGIFV